MQSRCIIRAVPGYSDCSAQLNQSMYKHELVIWLGASQHFEPSLNLLQLSYIANCPFYAYFVLLRPLFPLNSTVNLGSELGACHTNKVVLVITQVLISQDASLASDSLCSIQIVTCNHTNIDTGQIT